MVRKVVNPPRASRPGVDPAARTWKRRSSIWGIVYATVASSEGLHDQQHLRGTEAPRDRRPLLPLHQDNPPGRAADLRPRRPERRGGQAAGRAPGRRGPVLQGRTGAARYRRLFRADRVAGETGEEGL